MPSEAAADGPCHTGDPGGVSSSLPRPDLALVAVDVGGANQRIEIALPPGAGIVAPWFKPPRVTVAFHIRVRVLAAPLPSSSLLVRLG